MVSMPSDHVEQQQFALRIVAGELVGLDRGTQRDDLVRVEVGERIASEELGNRAAHLRHPGGSADQHHAFDFVPRQLCIAQRLAHGAHGARRQVAGLQFEVLARDANLHRATAGRDRHVDHLLLGQLLLDLPGQHLDGGFFGRRLGRDPRLLQQPVGQRAVVVVATQRRITARGHDFEDALRQAKDGDVEGATAQVVDGVDTLAGVVQPVGDGGSGGFVDQSQHVQPGQLRRILGGLALRIVEVGGDGDHHPVEVFVEGVLGAVAQRSEDLGADFHRRLLAFAGVQRDHARMVGKAVRQLLAVRNVRESAPHEALDRRDGVLRILRLSGLGIETDLPAALSQVAHDGGQDHPAFRIRQALGHAVAHGCDQRVRGAEVDADGDAALVGIGRSARFGDLQQGHDGSSRAAIVPVARGATRRPPQSAR
jgi:hypothetical protein